MFRRLPSAPSYTADELLALAESMHDDATPTSGWGGQVEDRDNPDIPAAYTYFGQFIDHDITFDPMSSLQRLNDPDALVDFRTPRFDLDSVYGSGPADEPFQYASSPGAPRFLTAGSGTDIDLPRNSEGIALIGDPRNDENIIVSQLHTVFLRAHNRFVAVIDADSNIPADRRFDEAQRLTRWHYQWIVVNDYLRKIVGNELLDQLLTEKNGEWDIKRNFYRPQKNTYMPVEFSVAAFRFGHSMIRGIYNLNPVVRDRPIFAPGDNVGPLDDLRGGRALPAQWGIQWDHFLPIKESAPQPSRKIDAGLASGLFDLPRRDDTLPFLNLKRGQALQLPRAKTSLAHWATFASSRALNSTARWTRRRYGSTSSRSQSSKQAASAWGRRADGSWPRSCWGCWRRTVSRTSGRTHIGLLTQKDSCPLPAVTESSDWLTSSRGQRPRRLEIDTASRSTDLLVTD